MEGYREIERFNEKRVKISVVESVSSGVKNIVKLYPNSVALRAETVWLQKFAKSPTVRVPKIIRAEDHEILLEYISGRTLLQELIDGAMFKVNMLAGLLARYERAFFEESGGYVFDEMNLHGYIMRGGLLNGFDFVSARPGVIEELPSETVATVLVDTRISDVRKQLFIREFMRIFGGSVLQYKERILALMKDKINRYGVKGVTVDELYKIVGKV